MVCWSRVTSQCKQTNKQTCLRAQILQEKENITSISYAHLDLWVFLASFEQSIIIPTLYLSSNAVSVKMIMRLSPDVSMATLICILKNDAVGRGGVTEGREVVCRISPINASAIWAKFVPCSTLEGSESIYRKHSPAHTGKQQHFNQ